MLRGERVPMQGKRLRWENEAYLRFPAPRVTPISPLGFVVATVGAFVILPMLSSDQPLLTTVAALAYPVLDLVMLAGLIRLRMARVLLAKGDSEATLKLLDGVSEKAAGQYAGLYAELRGDALVVAKRPVDARAAYAKARELGDHSPLLELKLNDLPAAP